MEIRGFIMVIKINIHQNIFHATIKDLDGYIPAGISDSFKYV